MVARLCRDDAELNKLVLAGLRRYQHTPRAERLRKREVVARVGRTTLQKLAGAPAASQFAAPLVLIPSLINPPDVLDLAADRSLMQFLAAQGHDVHLVDWGEPEPGDRSEGLAGHIEQRLLPLLGTLPAQPILLGYCLGGTIAIGAASVMAAAGSPARALISIAAPWDFSAYDADFRDQVTRIWHEAQSTCTLLGLVPMEVLQTGFWALDAERTVRKYADFGALPSDDPRIDAFMSLEDWANAGAPLTLSAGRDLLEGCYRNNLTGRGAWQIGSVTADPKACACPSLAVSSTRDRIVPANAAPWAHDTRALDLGHVGMMVGSKAITTLWEPLAAWLSLHRTGC
jgi:polyhydroxyalkanoate synthase subunit PhaC